MYQIQTLNAVAQCGLDRLPKDSYEVGSEINNPDGIILRSYNMHELDLSSNVKAIARAGAGVNNIPVAEYTKKGIVVFNTPGANANAVKEMVLASLFLSSRNILNGIEWTQALQGQGSEVPQLVEAGKKQFVGKEIKGKKLGVIGLGAIGALVANDALALEMEVVGYDPYVSVETAWRLSRNVQRAMNIEEVFATCDYITIHVPYLPQTKGFINKEVLSVMKKGVSLFNFSRGELVNNEDLLQAIEEGIVGTYVTDFPSEEVLGKKNVITIPHLGASTAESEDNCAVMAANQVKEYLETGNIKHSVNYPDVSLPYIGKKRITIAHENVPNMVGQITTVLAAQSINIADMINRSRGEYAYTLIDIDNHTDTIMSIKEELISKLQEIAGVVVVRVII